MDQEHLIRAVNCFTIMILYTKLSASELDLLNKYMKLVAFFHF